MMTLTVAVPETYVREAGSGPGVVCIHANASSSGQWRGLMEHLAPSFHVLAADSYGSGRGPAFPPQRPTRLSDEVELLEPVFARAGSPFVIVGHSYGAAVALIAALSYPGRVRALALYEPTLFSLIEARSPSPNEADGIRHAVSDALAALIVGDRDAAAERFIDYWMGEGAWQRMPESRKGPILESIGNVPRWGHALLTDPTPLAAFKALDIPVLYMVGERSRASALSVARILAPTLQRVRQVAFEELGHMGPVTHPEIVNEVIADFLETCA
jgi:pimeloyl-ACP methyl ester carboxylesterase